MHGGNETVSALASKIEVEANFWQIFENPLQNLFNATSLHSFPYLVTKSFPGKCVTSLFWHSLLKINLMTKFHISPLSIKMPGILTFPGKWTSHLQPRGWWYRWKCEDIALESVLVPSDEALGAAHQLGQPYLALTSHINFSWWQSLYQTIANRCAWDKAKFRYC